jgi:hypothetical protein
LSFIAVRKHRKQQAAAISDARKEAEESRSRMEKKKNQNKAARNNTGEKEEEKEEEKDQEDNDVAISVKQVQQHHDDDKEQRGIEQTTNTTTGTNHQTQHTDDLLLDDSSSTNANNKVCFCFDPLGSFVKRVNGVITSKTAENAVNGCILVNSIFLAMEYYHMPPWYSAMLTTVGIFFTFFFLFEMVFKIIGLGGWNNYAFLHEDHQWNIFDAAIVAMTCLDFLLGIIPDAGGLIPLSLLRVFRLGR